MNNVLDAKTGVKDTLPTVLGYVGIGTAFGIIAHTNGFSPLETFVMSLLVYTASGEFALVSMTCHLFVIPRSLNAVTVVNQADEAVNGKDYKINKLSPFI